MPTSISEERGLSLLTPSDQWVYSVGISTAGVAEIAMAENEPSRHITATTIDVKGAEFAQAEIDTRGLSHQIEVKLEDVAKPLPYKEESFDFIYARLVLHYLPHEDLQNALGELQRILKPGGKIFIVMRSTQTAEAQKSIYDPETHLSTFTTESGVKLARFFHNEKTITDYLEGANFHIQSIDSYEEQLYVDFERKIPATTVDHLLEVIAVK